MSEQSPVWISDEARRYMRDAAHSLDCAVQLCAAMSAELSAMEERLDELADTQSTASQSAPPKDASK